MAEVIEQEAVQERMNGLMKLAEMTCELAVQHDLNRILKTVTSGVCEAIGCERASLFLYDADKKELYTRVATELEIEEIREPLESGITGWVARHRQLANVPRPQDDPRWNSSVDRKTGFQTRNILAGPVISSHDGRLLGVLQLLNKHHGTFNEFDEQLLCAFASHAATALERAELLEEARRSHELQLSVEMGRHIQRSFLPVELPQVPGYETAVWWEPAEAVSGDYYDLVQLPDGRLGLVIADVSGHGVGPSLIMASVRAMLHVVTRRYSEPDRILSLISETIAPDLREGRFITFFMGALDTQNHVLSYANAGHGPALHFERSEGTFRTLQSTGLPLGVVEEASIEPGPELELAPGDVLFLGTDGAVEVRNPNGDLFGRERLQQLIYENRRRPAVEILEAVRKAIIGFCPSCPPADDVTLLVLERKLR